MPTRKQEKRRRKLRVHGPSTDAVGAPPTGRKPAREDAPEARTARSPRTGRREPAVPSLKRSARKGAIMGAFLIVVVLVTSRGHNSPSPLVTLLELAPFIPLFVLFDLWMARKVYKKVTGREAPR
jgi:hypothetical protein